MSHEFLTNEELVRFVMNSDDASERERILAERLDGLLQRVEYLEDEIDNGDS